MHARALPFLAGAVLVLLPGVASAAPSTAAVQNTFGDSRIAQGEVVLPDGRMATVWLGQYGGTGQAGAWSELYVEVECESTSSCLEGGSGLADLTPGQVEFSGGLREASVTDIDLTLYSWDERSQDQIQRQVTVSAAFEGTGQVTRDAAHGDQCSVMGATCQSVTVEASRSAVASLTLDGKTGTGTGTLSSGRYLSVGAPR